jgi:hypothetical protein
MNKQILVVLRRRDTADQMMPYLEQVAKPGMRVVFMLPYPVESWPYLKDHWIEADTARAALSASEKVLERYSWDAQKRIAEQKIAHLRAIFQKRDVDVGVDLYAGSLKRIVREHELDETIHLIVARPEGRGWARGLLARALASVSRRSPHWLSVRVFNPSLYKPGATGRTS